MPERNVSLGAAVPQDVQNFVSSLGAPQVRHLNPLARAGFALPQSRQKLDLLSDPQLQSQRSAFF